MTSKVVYEELQSVSVAGAAKEYYTSRKILEDVDSTRTTLDYQVRKHNDREDIL